MPNEREDQETQPIVGSVSRNAKTLLDGSPQPLNRLIHILLAGRGERSAEEEVLERGVLLGAEPGAAGAEDALFDARVEDFFLDFDEGAGGLAIWVGGVIYFQP